MNNTYGADLAEGEVPPSPVPPHLIIRSILADKPRVTRFPWPQEPGEAGENNESDMAAVAE